MQIYKKMNSFFLALTLLASSSHLTVAQESVIQSENKDHLAALANNRPAATPTESLKQKEPQQTQPNSTDTSAPNTPTQEEIKLSETGKQQLDQNCILAVRLDGELNYLISYANKAILSNLKDFTVEKKALLNTIVKEMRNLISQMVREKSIIESIGNPELLTQINYSFAELCSAMIDHVHALLQSKLTDIKPFDIISLSKKSPPTELNSTIVQQKVALNEKKLKALRAKIDTVGLTRFNKFARFIDNKFVTPWQEYGLSKGVKILGITALVGTLAAWHYGAHQMNLQMDNLQKERQYGQDLALIREQVQNKAIPIEKLKAIFPAEYFDAQGNPHLEKLYTHIDEFSKMSPQALKDNPDIALSMEDLSQKIWLHDLKKEVQLPGFIVKLFEWLGQPLPYSRGHLDLDEIRRHPGNYGRFSNAMNLLHDVMSSHLPLVSTLGATAIGYYAGLWNGAGDGNKKVNLTGGIKGWASQHIQQMWNKARGGLHQEQQIEGNFDFEPTFGFEEVIGLDEAKEMVGSIIHFIENIEMNMNIGITPELGYLFTGKTRTGKTYLFEALCGEIVRTLTALGKPNLFKFKIIPAEHIIQIGIKPILEWAKEQGPIVLFIDEIDLLQLNRVGQSTLLAEFLTAIGSAFNKDPKKPVIIISATNKPHRIDEALRQPGRLGKEIHFERPSLKIRINYLLHQFNKMAIDITNFDIVALAQKTAGKSIEDLHMVLASAARHSWMYGEPMSQELLEKCINSELRHILELNSIKTDNSGQQGAARKELSIDEQKIVATHFAGKAVAAHLVNLIKPLDIVTIKPIMQKLNNEVKLDLFDKENENNKSQQKRIVYGGLFTKQLFDTVNFKTYEQTINEIKILVAGFVAEELLLGNCAYSCHSDSQEKAMKRIRKIIFAGLNKKELSKEVERELSKKAYDLLQQCKQEVKALLAEHIPALKAVGGALIEQQILNDQEVALIVGITEGTIDIEALKAQFAAHQKEQLQHQQPDELASMVQTPATA